MKGKTPTQYQLIAIGRDAATGLSKLESHRLLSDEEFRGFRRSVDHLLEYREFSSAFARVLDEVRAFQTGYVEISRLENRLKNDQPAQEQAKLHLNALLDNFLSAFRALLDRSQTRLTRRWGAKSAIVATFKRATSCEFDASPAYRFYYKLRNFAQHCGAPIRMVAVDTWVEDPPDGPHRARVRIDRSPEDLLDRYAEWGRVRDDLRGFGESVPLNTLASELEGAITRVFEAVLEAEVPHYFASGQAVVKLLSEVDAPNETGAVAEVGAYANGRQHISMIEPPMDVLRLMRMVADEST